MDKDNNQSSLFDNKEHEDDFEFLPSIPWKQKELLSEEFKSLGFYISDHPSMNIMKFLINLGIISYNQVLSK